MKLEYSIWARTTGKIALDLVERHRLFRQRNMMIE